VNSIKLLSDASYITKYIYYLTHKKDKYDMHTQKMNKYAIIFTSQNMCSKKKKKKTCKHACGHCGKQKKKIWSGTPFAYVSGKQILGVALASFDDQLLRSDGFGGVL
jgi:hypothetical protein